MPKYFQKITMYPLVDEEEKIRIREERKQAFESSSPLKEKGLELCKKLSQLQFWCGDNKIHLKDPDYHLRFCCLTHVVRLPRHPATKEEMPLTHFQIEFVNTVINAVSNSTSTDAKIKAIEALENLRKAHLFHINKGRQMGFTEIILRLIQFFCFSRYAGSKVGIIAATNGKLAKKDLRRFAALFKTITPVVEKWVTGMYMKLVNETEIEAFPASEEALTGDTQYKCIFMDEAGKWKLVDDAPVFNSVEPIIRASGGDLFLNSTPKGPVKTFYKIHNDKNSEYIKLTYDIMLTKDNLYTGPEIQRMISSSTVDPDQEYFNKFTIGQNSILGSVTDQDRGEGWAEWNQEDDEEDDGFDSEVDELDWAD